MILNRINLRLNRCASSDSLNAVPCDAKRALTLALEVDYSPIEESREEGSERRFIQLGDELQE